MRSGVLCRGVVWQGAAIDYVWSVNSLRLEDPPKLILFCRRKGPVQRASVHHREPQRCPPAPAAVPSAHIACRRPQQPCHRYTCARHRPCVHPQPVALDAGDHGCGAARQPTPVAPPAALHARPSLSLSASFSPLHPPHLPSLSLQPLNSMTPGRHCPAGIGGGQARPAALRSAHSPRCTPVFVLDDCHTRAMLGPAQWGINAVSTCTKLF